MRIPKLLLALGIMVGVGLIGTASAQAINAQRGDTLSVSKDQVVDASIYRAGKRVLIEGRIKGDVYCAGQTVEITGVVEGDVLCAAQELRLDGTVEGDVRAGAQNIYMLGTVKGSATLMGQMVSIENKASIGRDLTVGTQTLRLAGKVGRDVVSAGNLSTFAGLIGRNADVYAEGPTIQSTAAIGGNLTYTSNQDAHIDNGAKIKGHTTHHTPSQKEGGHSFWPGWLRNPLYWLLSMLVVGLAVLLLVPRWFKATGALMQQRPLGTLGLGLAGLILTPIVAIGLIVTLIGLPLGIPLLIAWIFVCLASFTFAAYALGSWLMRYLQWLEHGRNIAALLMGALLLVILAHIPYLGFWVSLLAILWGIGGIYWAVARGVRNQHANPRIKAKKA